MPVKSPHAVISDPRWSGVGTRRVQPVPPHCDPGIVQNSGVGTRRSTWEFLRFILMGLSFGTFVSPGRAADPIIESFIAQATTENPRHTEADVLVLRDGTLFAAWAEFYGGARDDAPARITSARSTESHTRI